MSNDSTVAPKERVNIVFKSTTDGLQEDKELPLRLLMLGDYTLSKEERILEDIPVISINKHNFDDVLNSKHISLDMVVDNKLDSDASEIPVSLTISKMSDFNPDSIVLQVPELKTLLDVRHALTSLKGPLGNVPAFRKHMQSILQSKDSREKLLLELNENDSNNI